MTRERDSESDQILPIDAIITWYQERANQGRPPDRNELIARFPELANDLKLANALWEYIENADALAGALGPIIGKAPGGGPQRQPPPEPGSTFGRYKIQKQLGRGMGIVHEAVQLQPERHVALKTLRDGRNATEEDRERFSREVMTAASLQHPNIVPILEFGDVDGQPYFTMPLLTGGCLSQWVKEHRPDVRSLAAVVAILARAVHYAHERGILHRDLKPANVLFDGHDVPFIADFGLSRSHATEESLTRTGEILGSGRYMSPEQAAGRQSEVTVRTDVYGLGTVLYAALTGGPPFRDCPDAEILLHVLKYEPQPLRNVDPHTPRDLDTICQKCLNKIPASRYVSALALAEDLERFVAGKPILGRRASWTRRVALWVRRRPSLAALVFVSCAAVASIAYLSLVHVGALSRESTWRTNAELGTYSVRVTSAFDALRSGDYTAASELAKLVKPPNGGKDHRGIEWRILTKCFHPENWEITGPTITSAALSPDGNWLVTAGESGWLELRDALSGEVLRPLLPVRRSGDKGKWCFTPDSRRLVLVDSVLMDEYKVLLFSLDESRILWQIEGRYECFDARDPGAPGAIAASANGRWIALANMVAPTLILDAETGEKAAPDLPPADLLTFSPNSELLVLARSCGPGGWNLYDTATSYDTSTWAPAPQSSQPPPLGTNLAFSPDGALVASVFPDGRYHLFRLGSRWEELPPTFGGAAPGGLGIAWAPDGSELLGFRYKDDRSECFGTVWDPQTGSSLGESGHQFLPFDWAQFLPRGRRFLTLASAQGSLYGNIRQWSRNAMTLPLHLKPRGQKNAEIAVGSDGRHVFANWSDGAVERWLIDEDGATLDGVFEPFQRPAVSFNLAPDGSRLAAVEQGGALQVWDLDKYFAGVPRELCLEVEQKELTSSNAQPTFTPDGRYLVAARADGAIFVWRCVPGEGQEAWPLRKQILAPGETRIFATSLSGRLVAASSYYAYWILLIDLEDLSVRKCVSRFGENVQAMAISPDERYLAAARSDGNIAVWVMDKIRPGVDAPPSFLLERHEPEAHAVLFTLDSTRLVTGGSDKVLKFWVVTDEQPDLGWPLAAEIRGLDIIPECLRVSNNDRLLLVSGGKTLQAPDEVIVFPIAAPPGEIDGQGSLIRW